MIEEDRNLITNSASGKQMSQFELMQIFNKNWYRKFTTLSKEIRNFCNIENSNKTKFYANIATKPHRRTRSKHFVQASRQLCSFCCN